jgi:hypothetical protein
MNPFTALLGSVRAPVWRGPVRSHVLIGSSGGNYAKRWTPWTLIEPGVTLPTRGVIAGCWALTQGSRA